eukprot:scaffold64738_cov66-Cyclotella_meneghiniana.AAC.5
MLLAALSCSTRMISECFSECSLECTLLDVFVGELMRISIVFRCGAYAQVLAIPPRGVDGEMNGARGVAGVLMGGKCEREEEITSK